MKRKHGELDLVAYVQRDRSDAATCAFLFPFMQLLPEMRREVRAAMGLETRSPLARASRKLLAEEPAGAFVFPADWRWHIARWVKDRFRVQRHPLTARFMRAIKESGCADWPHVPEHCLPTMHANFIGTTTVKNFVFRLTARNAWYEITVYADRRRATTITTHGDAVALMQEEARNKHLAHRIALGDFSCLM